MPEKISFQTRMRRVEELVHAIQSPEEQNLRSRAVELVQLLMELHGAGLNRMLELISQTGAAGDAIIDEFTREPLVASLLLLYDLHPLDLEARVRQALDKVRPYLRSHGGNVKLLGIEEGVVRLRLEGSCHGCPSSSLTLKLAIEEAMHELAPDAADLVVEGVVAETPRTAFVPLVQLNQVAAEVGEP